MRPRNVRRQVAGLLGAGALALTCLAPAASAAATPPGCAGAVTTYVPPAGSGTPFGVVADARGAWFAHGGTIDRVRDGALTEHPVPDPDNAAVGWLTARAGLIWFAARGDGRLGTIDSSGAVTETQIPDGANGTPIPQSIVFRRGTLWFTDEVNDRIGSLDPATGAFVFRTVPTGDPLGMVLGRDGDLYFTERAFDKVGRLDPRTGLFAEWTLTAGAFPNRLTSDPYGNVWFTELRTSLLGRIDPAGHLHETALPGGPVGITYSHGHLFAAMATAGALDEITLRGHVVRSWPLPDAVTVLQVSVRQRVAWVTDGFADHVYRVDTACR